MLNRQSRDQIKANAASASDFNSSILKERPRAGLAAPFAFSLIAGAVFVTCLLVVTTFVPLGAPGNGATMGGTLASADGDSRSGYQFSNVRVANGGRNPGDRGKATITFGYQWATRDNPGIRDCVFTAFDDAGEVVAQATERFGTMQRANPNVPIELMVSDGASPRSASIECGERLDGPGTYLFSNVRVWAPPVDQYSEIIVEYSAEWRGSSAVPGASDCIVTVYDSEGVALVSDTIAIISESGFVENGIHPINVTESLSGRPDDAEVACN